MIISFLSVSAILLALFLPTMLWNGFVFSKYPVTLLDIHHLSDVSRATIYTVEWSDGSRHRYRHVYGRFIIYKYPSGVREPFRLKLWIDYEISKQAKIDKLNRWELEERKIFKTRDDKELEAAEREVDSW